MSVKCFQCPVNASNHSMNLTVVGGGWGWGTHNPQCLFKKNYPTHMEAAQTPTTANSTSATTTTTVHCGLAACQAL